MKAHRLRAAQRERRPAAATFASSCRSGERSSSTQNERPCVADDEVAVPHVDVADRAVGQVELQRLPVIAVVEGDEDAGLGPGVEEAAPDRILAHDVDEAARGNSRGDRAPALAAVARAVDVGRDVVEPVPVDGGVGGVGVEMRRLDDPDLRPGRERLRASRSPSSRRRPS